MSTIGVAARSVVVVDDHALLRAGTRQILEQNSRLRVVGEAGTVEEAIRVVDSEHPDVVLMDIRLPDGSGLDGARRIVAKNPYVKVVVLSAYDDDDYIRTALALGVAGFLLKTVKSEDLVHAVQAASDGMVVLDPAIIARLRKSSDSSGDSAVLPEVLQEVVSSLAGSALDPAVTIPSGSTGATSVSDEESPEAGDENNGLSDREVDVIRLIGMGLSNKSIGNRLYISTRTVEGHLNKIFAKLDVHSRTELMRYAYTSGIVSVRGGA
ncbi:MAG: response regulator [Acidimicrobiales bacterium]